MTVRRAIMGLGLAAAFAGCSGGELTSAEAVNAEAAAEVSERVAQALADADAAAEAGDRTRLVQALRVIDAAGARALPEGDDDPLPAWRALANDAMTPTRGSPLGPGYRRGRLDSGQSARIEQLFLSGKRARIAISTPDSSALTLRVRDARDGAVCERSAAPGGCQWVPVFTQRYSIEIANRGTRAARYYLVVE
jgi:hypothetical protein